ncbi:MAG TPA: PEGA domain-containing protein, partial [Thermoanaerobaculia bacterium]
EKDRDRRFGNAREFRTALEATRGALADRPGFGFEQLLRTDVTPLPATLSSTEPAARQVSFTTQRAPEPDSHEAATRIDAQPTLRAAAETEREPAVETIRAASPRGRLVAAAAVVALVVVGTLAAMFVRQRAAAREGSVEIASSTAAASTLAVDAFPWGEVVSVRDLATGSLVDVGRVTTPAAIDLPAGRYEVIVRNPAYANLLTQQVTLAGGETRRMHVQFAEASVASMPELVAK